MVPGKAKVLTCPHCGGEKEVLFLLSGNTFRQVVWSDNKKIAPMLPTVSFVQKCQSCGKYFLMSSQKDDKHSNNISFEDGHLSYQELKEAWQQMKDSTELSDGDKLAMLIMQVWGFNDEFTRANEKEIPSEELTYFKSIVEHLIALDSVNDLLKAELLREIGRFDDALKILESYSPANDFLAELQSKFRKYAEMKETRPFIIQEG